MLNGKTLTITVAVLALSASAVSSRGALPEDPRVEVKAKIVAERTLEFDVTLKAAMPVEVFESSLPWGSAYSALIVAADKTGTCLRRSRPIDDPGPARRTLIPGQTLSGRVQLDRRFPDLGRYLAQSDIVVFWMFEARKSDGTSLGSGGGWQIISRAGKH